MLNAGLKALCVQDVIHSILPQSLKFALVVQRRSALAVDAQTVVGWRYTTKMTHAERRRKLAVALLGVDDTPEHKDKIDALIAALAAEYELGKASERR